MSSTQLYIPSRIKVGFNARNDCFTGRLAYVIYYRDGKLRKETSWESWRDKKIDPVEHDNTPTDGFVLNKGVGGARASYGWDTRNEYVRVFDSRGFEFEISVSNLLFILRECDCSKGKGLEGKFVYAWDKTELVLLPVISTDYQNSQKFTELQSQGVKAKAMIPGATYTTKKQEQLVFVGRFDFHFITRTYHYPETNKCEKRWVFWTGKKFVVPKDLKSIAVCQSDTVAPDYAELVDKYLKSCNGSKIVRLFTKEYKAEKRWQECYWVAEKPAGTFLNCTSHFKYNSDVIERMSVDTKVTFQDGRLEINNASAWGTPSGTADRYTGYPGSYYGSSQIAYIQPTGLALYAELESGKKFRLAHGHFIED